MKRPFAKRSGDHRSIGILLTLLIASIVHQPALGQKKASSEDAKAQYQAAVIFFNQAVESSGDAKITAAKLNYSLAADEWNVFLKDFPDDPLAAQAQHYRGYCHFQMKQYDKAIESYKNVVAKYPNFKLLEETYFYLGNSQLELGQTQQGNPKMLTEAQASFDALIQKFPNGKQAANAHYFKGESLYKQGKKSAALKAYRLALKKMKTPSPLRPDALYALGYALEALNQSSEADKTYDQFLADYGKSKHPLLYEIYFRKGETRYALKQFDKALSWYLAAARAPGFENADLATMRQAESMSAQKKYAEAASVFASIPMKFSKSTYVPKAKVSAGICYYMAGDYPKARKWLTAVMDSGGAPAIQSARWIAESYLKEKKPAKALAVLDKILPKAKRNELLPVLLKIRAEALFELPSRRKESAALYSQIAAKYDKHQIAPQSLYMAAYAAQGLEQFSQSLKLADRFMTRYSNHPQGKSLVPNVIFIAAECNLQLEKSDQAQKLFTLLLKQFPNHQDTKRWKVRLALVHFLGKQFDKTIKTLEADLADLSELKDAELLAEARFLIGSSQFEMKQYAAAGKSLRSSVAAKPDWRQADETLILLSRVQQNLGDLKSARQTVAKLIQQFPDSPVLDEAHYRSGEYAFRGTPPDFKTSWSHYQRVIKKWPHSPFLAHAISGLGWSQLNLKSYEAAEKTFTTLIRQHATHSLVPDAHHARSIVREKLKKYALAIEDVAVFFKSSPPAHQKLEALFLKGRSQSGLKQFDAAVTTFQAILADPAKFERTDEVLYELAWTLKDLKKNTLAAKTFFKLSKNHPKSSLAAESHHHVGEHLYQEKKYEQAAAAYYAATTKAGKTEIGEKAAHKLAFCYFHQDNFVKAYGSFAYQVNSFPKGKLVTDATYMMGESLFNQDKYREALEIYLKVEEKKLSFKDFRILLLLHAGQSAGQLGQWKQCLELLEQLTTTYPNADSLPEALYEQGWAKQNQKDYDAALKLYEQVAKRRTVTGVRARFMMGEIYFLKKNYREAFRHFFRVAKGFPNAPKPFDLWKAKSTFEAAQCMKELNKPVQAKKFYNELIEKFPKSDLVPLAKKRLAALGS